MGGNAHYQVLSIFTGTHHELKGEFQLRKKSSQMLMEYLATNANMSFLLDKIVQSLNVCLKCQPAGSVKDRLCDSSMPPTGE